MSFFILFLAWYIIFGKRNPNIYRNISDKIGKIFGVAILFSIITSILPGIKILTYGLLAFILGFAPFALVVWIILKALGVTGNKRKNVQDNWGDYYRQSATGNDPYMERMKNKKGKKRNTVTGPSLTGLSKSVPKRRKIVDKFNKKYNLNLTEDEVARIVDASYMSFAWEREIYDMSQEMNSLYEWYNGETDWLRAYLRVFPIQNVSSDFKRQMEMCLEAYNQIFREIRPERFSNMDSCIDAINNRYFTFFDETTFMIAYRFLQKNGKNYELPSAKILHNESDLESLMHKYDKDVNRDKEKIKEKQNRRYGV